MGGSFLIWFRCVAAILSKSESGCLMTGAFLTKCQFVPGWIASAASVGLNP